MRAIVIGFPKAGTSSIQRAFKSLDWNSVHQAQDGFIPGALMHRNYKRGKPILSGLEDIAAITQLDICHPSKDLVCFPQLDMGFLRSLQIESPSTRLILNKRDLAKHSLSIMNWGDLHSRLIQAGLLTSKSREELEEWISNHYANLTNSGLSYYTVWIDRESAEIELRRAIGRGIAYIWWGNEDPKGKENQ